MTFFDKFIIILVLILGAFTLWGIMLIGEQQQELVRLRAEVAGHWTIVRIYNDQAVAWKDYQKSLKEGKMAAWRVGR